MYSDDDRLYLVGALLIPRAVSEPQVNAAQ